ncbi:MAG: hypothetical protein RKL32_21185 [Gammaproteobacteria bacterium]
MRIVIDHAGFPATVRAVPCTPRERSAFQGIHLAVPAAALLSRGEALARFDAVLLTTGDGRVLGEWGTAGAAGERPGIHQEIPISSDRIDLAGLFEQVQFDRLNDAQQPRLDSFPLEAPERRALRELQRGDAWVSEIAHGEDVITVTKLPFHPEFPVTDRHVRDESADVPDGAVGQTTLNVVGFSRDEILLEAMRDVSPLWILLLSGLVLVSLLAWPLARLLLLGPHNSVPFWYVRLGLVAMVTIVALLTTAGLVSRHYLGSMQAHRQGLADYSAQVEHALEERLDTLAALLRDYPLHTNFAARVDAALPPADDDVTPPAVSQCRPLAAFTRDEVHARTTNPRIATMLDTLGLQDVFYTDAAGCIRGIDLHMDHDRELGRRISVAPRGYFRAIEHGRPLLCAAGVAASSCSGPGGSVSGLPFAVERIFNWTSGERQVFLSVARPPTLQAPAASTSGLDPARGDFSGIVAGGVSLADFWIETARDGYRFAVFEEGTNTVLFHSDDTRALIENVVLETDQDALLRAALAARTTQDFVGRYHGADTLFRYTPIEAPYGTAQWGLLAMVPLELPQGAVLFTAALSTVLWLLLVGAALFTCALISFVWRRLPVAIRPGDALAALRGTREYAYGWRIIALAGILAVILAVTARQALAPWVTTLLAVLLTAAALLVMRIELPRAPACIPGLRPGARRHLPTMAFSLLTAIVGVALVVPTYEGAMRVLESERAAVYAAASERLAARYREQLVAECARRRLAEGERAACVARARDASAARAGWLPDGVHERVSSLCPAVRAHTQSPARWLWSHTRGFGELHAQLSAACRRHGAGAHTVPTLASFSTLPASYVFRAWNDPWLFTLLMLGFVVLFTRTIKTLVLDSAFLIGAADAQAPGPPESPPPPGLRVHLCAPSRLRATGAADAIPRFPGTTALPSDESLEAAIGDLAATAAPVRLAAPVFSRAVRTAAAHGRLPALAAHASALLPALEIHGNGLPARARVLAWRRALATPCPAALGDIAALMAWLRLERYVFRADPTAREDVLRDDAIFALAEPVLRPVYAAHWRALDITERLFLYQVAIGHMPKLGNATLVRRMARHSALRVCPLGLRSEPYRRYIRDAEATGTFEAWQAAARSERWEAVRTPGIILVVLLVGLLVFISGTSLHLVAGAVGSLVAIIGGLSQLTAAQGGNPD